jgi:hypothetical protein
MHLEVLVHGQVGRRVDGRDHVRVVRLGSRRKGLLLDDRRPQLRLFDLLLQREETFLDCIGLTVHDFVDLFGLELKSQLSKHFSCSADRHTIKSVPVRELLLHIVSTGVVMKVHDLFEVLFHDLSHHQAVREVSPDVLLGPAELMAVHPAINLVQVFVSQYVIILHYYQTALS